MIVDIPTESDFYKSSARFLASAWSDALSWAQLDIFEKEEREKEEKVDSLLRDSRDILGEFTLSSEESNAPSQTVADAEDTQALAIAHITAYTGIEHLLRARIAAVSPFLLISGTPPQNWPGKGQARVPFADFRTVDAQDLILIHNVVSAKPLPSKFEEIYESLRRQRNALIHSHGARPKFAARELMVAILYTTHVIEGPMALLKRRREMLAPRVRSDDYSWQSTLNGELEIATKTLGASDLRTYLGIRKRSRFYFCPHCLDGCTRTERKSGYFQSGVAQLDPDDRTCLVCPTCDSRSKVERHDCVEKHCPGNVIYEAPEYEPRCMTCASYQEK